MSEEEKTNPQEGSATEKDAVVGSPNPNDLGGPTAIEQNGESPETAKPSTGEKQDVDMEQYVPKKDYEEASKTIGTQGKELGDMRNFFKEISPLLDRLQDQPEVVEAIMEGKFNVDMAKAVLDGKVPFEAAEKVVEAHEKVKKDMGNKEYENTSPEAIEKLVTEKVGKMMEEQSSKFQKEISKVEERRELETATLKFVETTDDFDKYAEDVTKWLEDNPKIWDIRIAYEAVKGREVLAKASEDATAKAADAAKSVAPQGGPSQGTGSIDSTEMIDSLISPRGNPNTF